MFPVCVCLACVSSVSLPRWHATQWAETRCCCTQAVRNSATVLGDVAYKATAGQLPTKQKLTAVSAL